MKKFAGLLFFFVVTFGLPAQVSPDFDSAINHEVELPIVFDLRVSGILSPVKSQPGGGCWTSAAHASIESFWRRTGMHDVILSDRNVQIFNGFVESRRTYGNHHMITAVYSRRAGPLIKNPETDTLRIEKPDLPAVLTGARYLPDSANLIKSVIQRFGGVYSMMFHSQSNGLDTVTNIYYAPNETINHAVCLVGWNDTMKTRQGRGVWIAQNSLGTKYADSGFFYIPYQDENILKHNAVWTCWKEPDPAAELYYYDTTGSYHSYGFGNPLSYGLVKFTAKHDGYVTGIATHINHAHTEIKGFVYSDFDGKKLEPADLVDSTENKFCRFPGYYSVDVARQLEVKKGQTFYVAVKYHAPGTELPMPVEKYVKDYCVPHIETGTCWIAPDIEKWPATWHSCGADAENHNLRIDLCIRVQMIRK